MAKGGFIGWIIGIVLVIALAGFGYFKFFWVFSEGTKTGELNSLTYTGYLFKTYEGEMILTGYGTKRGGNGTVQSKNFKFSVSDKEVARELMNMTGLRVTVNFKEYKGALPWRGYERAIVYSVSEEHPAEPVAKHDDESLFL